MKRRQLVSIVILCLAVWGWAVCGPALAQGRGQGFRPCPYAPYSCPVKDICKPFDENGKVAQVFSESLEAAMQPGMALLVDTATQGQVNVSLGPVWFLERQEFEIAPGDEVRVKGMCETGKDGKLAIIAFQVTKGDHILALRDDQGRPYWEAWRKK